VSGIAELQPGPVVSLGKLLESVLQLGSELDDLALRRISDRGDAGRNGPPFEPHDSQDEGQALGMASFEGGSPNPPGCEQVVGIPLEQREILSYARPAAVQQLPQLGQSRKFPRLEDASRHRALEQREFGAGFAHALRLRLPVGLAMFPPFRAETTKVVVETIS
jgi:hypothetical protein